RTCPRQNRSASTADLLCRAPVSAVGWSRDAPPSARPLPLEKVDGDIALLSTANKSRFRSSHDESWLAVNDSQIFPRTSRHSFPKAGASNGPGYRGGASAREPAAPGKGERTTLSLAAYGFIAQRAAHAAYSRSKRRLPLTPRGRCVRGSVG